MVGKSQWDGGLSPSTTTTSVDSGLRLQETLDFLSPISQTRDDQESTGGCGGSCHSALRGLPWACITFDSLEFGWKRPPA
jgi:hypothetical protein